VNLGSAPLGILLRQASDQIPDLSRDPWPSAARTRPSAPVESKTGAMPADHSLGFDNEEDLGPAGPDATGVIQNNRSPACRDGRGRWRLSTATCWRRARISRAVSLRERKKTWRAQHSEEQLDHEVTVVARAANPMARSAQTTDFTMR
jgi:hypothetical protein